MSVQKQCPACLGFFASQGYPGHCRAKHGGDLSPVGTVAKQDPPTKVEQESSGSPESSFWPYKMQNANYEDGPPNPPAVKPDQKEDCGWLL